MLAHAKLVGNAFASVIPVGNASRVTSLRVVAVFVAVAPRTTDASVGFGVVTGMTDGTRSLLDTGGIKVEAHANFDRTTRSIQSRWWKPVCGPPTQCSCTARRTYWLHHRRLCFEPQRERSNCWQPGQRDRVSSSSTTSWCSCGRKQITVPRERFPEIFFVLFYPRAQVLLKKKIMPTERERRIFLRGHLPPYKPTKQPTHVHGRWRDALHRLGIPERNLKSNEKGFYIIYSIECCVKN